MEQIFREIEPVVIRDNPFHLIGEDCFLLTGGTITSYNTMTANWAGLGYLWHKNVSWCFVRPERYTYEFMGKSNYHTFSFFAEQYRNVLEYCGEHSGKNVNKIEKTGITPVEGPFNTVYFGEARLVIVSRKLYIHDIDRNNFLDHTVLHEIYPPDIETHRMYIGEVVSCLMR